MKFNYLQFCAAILLILFNSNNGHGQQLICENRFPEGHVGTKTVGDGSYKLVIVGPHAIQGQYVPNEVYTVGIQGFRNRYSTQKFTEFLLVVESDKQLMMGQSGLITTGIFHIIDDTQTKYSDYCADGVASINPQPKSEISVLWTAPSVLVASCVTFKTTVVERPHVWYMDDGELSKTLCPYRAPTTTTTTTTTTTPIPVTTTLPPLSPGIIDSRRAHALSATTTRDPSIGSCCPCDEAKYEVTFEGIWSRETHPRDFPENEWLLHFSDIIGASHSADYYFWQVEKDASEGIRHVAEWGSTRQLEKELKAKSKYINTIIKARGLWHPNEKGQTSAAFRVDRNRHLMSLVTMIGPSPDWFVGISGVDLCTANCTWAEEANFDLFPYDAGTDSGVTYMSPNTPTDPRGTIKALSETYPNDTSSPFYDTSGTRMRPFAKARIRRQRIYPKSCEEIEHDSETSHEIIVSENTEDASRPECSVGDWTSWSDCSVTCGKGLRMRKRSYNNTMKATMMDCDRQLVETEMCLANVHTCDSGSESAEEVDSICMVTRWTEWTPCSVTCGKGAQTRSRRYKNHLGRKKCMLEMSQTQMCTGMKEQCDPEPAPVNGSDPTCQITPWSEWTPCNVSCGDGFRNRARFHILMNDDDIIPSKCYENEMSQVVSCQGEYGDCSIGMAEAKEICMQPSETGPCRASKQRFFFDIGKGMCLPFTYGGCKGNRNRFDTLGECHVLCGFLGSGAQLGSDPIVQQNEQVDHEEDETDNSLQLGTHSKVHMLSSTSTSPEPMIMQKPEVESETIDDANITPLDIDCLVTEWTNWTACSVSCGLGHQIKTRNITIEPQNEGKRCPRRLKKRRICRMPSCPNGRK